MTQTIGQRLKAEREEQRLTLEKVFEATRIRVQYLQALEADDLSVMPSPVQARGYLRNYAEFLGFDVDQMLDEMRAMHAQHPSAEIIGPADETLASDANVGVAPIPHEGNGSLNAEPAMQTSESIDVAQNHSTPIEASIPSPRQDFAAQDHVLSDVTIPIKPKAARRKKTGLQPDVLSAESPTKQRGRKRVRPDVTRVVEAQSSWQSRVEEFVAPSEPVPQPESVPLPPNEAISQPEPFDSAKGATQDKSLAEEPVPFQQDVTPADDVNDKIWQTWLNRLNSVLSARGKRRTLIPKGSPLLESEPVVPPTDVTSEVKVQVPALGSSYVIAKEIGKELRQRRELLSLHFDEVEHNTHVKAHYLDALERGALDELPSTVQTRGMLANYATFLDLDVDVLLLRFADALQARHRERNPQKPPRKPGQPIIANVPPVRSFIAGDMIFGVSLAILLIGFAIWGVSRVMAIQSQREIKPTAPSISDVLLASPDPASFTATPTFLPVESFPGEATVTIEIPTQNVNAPVQLNLIAVERTYMRVVIDGEVAFEGRVLPGNAYPFEAENQIEVLVGSGAAIRTVYNGRDLGLMGTFGQVVNNIYLGSEVITPTALPTATPTITLTPTNTAPLTATSRFTDTPVPSVTAVP
jgi:cytoskeleton protein RodZ